MSLPYDPCLTPPAARIDFGWLGQAWSLFSAQAGVWVGALALFFILYTAALLLFAIPTGICAAMQASIAAAIAHPGTPAPSAGNPYRGFADTEVFGISLSGFTALMAGGLYRMALRQLRGEPISVGNLFSALPQSLPLLAVGVFVPAVLGLLEGAALWLMRFSVPSKTAIPVVTFAAWLPGLLLPGLVMFAPLLVVDAGASAPTALAGSVRLLGRQWLLGILFYVVTVIVSSLGILLCGVGMLATYPILFLSISLGYLVMTHSVPVAEMPFNPAPPGVWPPPPTMFTDQWKGTNQ